MARRSKDRQDRLGQLLTQVERRFQGSPLSPVGEMLCATLLEVRESAQAGMAEPEAVDHLADYTTAFLESIPSTFGDRFTFDFQFLSALIEDCSQGALQISSSLVPTPANSWGHQIISMPSISGKPAPAFELIHIPGEDNLEDINLLEYPFACHELGHNLLSKRGDVFSASFSLLLDEVVNGLRRQTLALQGASKEIANSTIDEIRQYWTPTESHRNWSHEIAVDVIALWTCGPAYLAALQDVLEDPKTNPYQLGQSHPPYEVRAKAMVETANQLGWAYYTGDCLNLVEGWPKSPWAADRTNLYAACADDRLVSGTVAAAIDACRALSLPLCTPEFVGEVREKLLRQELPDLGIELIVAAWVVRDQSDEGAYEAWERGVIRNHLDQLTE